jgi:hypothetical protein
MQTVFHTILGPEPLSIFESEEHWASYAKGASLTNQRWKGFADACSKRSDREEGVGAKTFQKTIEDSWVWMDVR